MVNLHWIPPFQRRKFINLALELAEKVESKKKIRLLPRIFYDAVKRGPYRFAIKGIRKYYLNRITNLQEIPPEFWSQLKPSDGRYKARKFYR